MLSPCFTERQRERQSRADMASWEPLRRRLADEPGALTLAWSELEALVGELPPSAYRYDAFWSGERSGWPGFRTRNVRVGESVTFVRPTHPSKRTPSPQVPLREPHSEGPDVVLIGCVKRKRTEPAPAKDLYTSSLFRKERAYAEASGAIWYILSAQHGLLDPDEVIAPYDLRLSTTTREYRDAWGEDVVARLGDAQGPLAGICVEIHAGAAYANAIRPRLEAAGVVVRTPLAGQSMGERLRWYGVAEPAPAAVPKPVAPAPDVSELVESLTAESRAVTPAKFVATEGEGLRSPGLYSWWVDASGADDLSRGLGQEIAPGLIYAGLAGATRVKSGRKSKNTLWGRIKGMHLGGRHEFSTFRLSLGSILASAVGDADIDEIRLTAWMHDHLRVIAIPVEDADSLDLLETVLLAELDPPLNLDKMPRTAIRRRLTELRRAHGKRLKARSDVAHSES